MSSYWTTFALSAVDMFATPITLPLFTFRSRNHAPPLPGGVYAVPPADVVGKAVIRRRAAPMGISVIGVVAPVASAGLCWSGVTTFWRSHPAR